MKKVPEEVQVLLKGICDQFRLEDRDVRDRQIRIWKKLKLYWSGFQRQWWSEVAHDWQVFDQTAYANSPDQGSNGYYDKEFNVFRAYLESIIAALSITVPPIKCFPD